MQRDHVRAARAGCLKRMTPGGVIYFSTNFRRFKFDERQLPGSHDPRDQPPDRPRRLPQPANPPLLANYQELSKRRWKICPWCLCGSV